MKQYVVTNNYPNGFSVEYLFLTVHGKRKWVKGLHRATIFNDVDRALLHTEVNTHQCVYVFDKQVRKGRAFQLDHVDTRYK